MSTIDKIRTLSKEKGLSLSFLCKKMNVNRVYFIDCEKTGRTIPDDKLSIIADCLSTTIEYLKGETDKKEKPTVKDDELSENMKQLIEFAKSVPDDKVELVLKVMKSIVEAD